MTGNYIHVAANYAPCQELADVPNVHVLTIRICLYTFKISLPLYPAMSNISNSAPVGFGAAPIGTVSKIQNQIHPRGWGGGGGGGGVCPAMEPGCLIQSWRCTPLGYYKSSTDKTSYV